MSGQTTNQSPLSRINSDGNQPRITLIYTDKGTKGKTRKIIQMH